MGWQNAQQVCIVLRKARLNGPNPVKVLCLLEYCHKDNPSRNTKITPPGIWKPRLSGARPAWSITLNHVFCRVVLVWGLEVIMILIEGLPGWYEERSHVWILYSGELPSSGDRDDRMSRLFRGETYHVFWWISSLGVRARPYTSRMVTALPDDPFHNTESRG